MQTTSANPVHSFPSLQDLNPGNDVSRRRDSLNRETSLSIFEMGPANPALEALGSGVCLSPRTTPLSENWSTSYIDENDWIAFGNQWSHTCLYQLPYEHLNIPSQFPRLETQNDTIMCLNPLQADPAPGTWNATGYNPVQTDDILVGIPGPKSYERDYHVHPTMQESDSSGISSLSSSYHYNCPESQPFATGHELPSLVPWSRPKSVEENLSGNLPRIQGPGLSAQPMTNPFSGRAVSGMQVRSRSNSGLVVGPLSRKSDFLLETLPLLTFPTRRAAHHYPCSYCACFTTRYCCQWTSNCLEQLRWAGGEATANPATPVDSAA
jgi:hypothetical protein